MKRLEAALAAIDAYAAGVTEDKQRLIAAKCRGLVYGYHMRWKDAGFSVESVERVVTSFLWNPETGRKSRSFTVAGKLDTTGSAGRRLLMDHKSTSEDITDPNAPFWRQLMIEGQVSHCMLLEWLNARKVEGAIWDVMRKPAISPRKLETKREIAEVLETARYHGRGLSEDSVECVRQTGRESYEMYEARLAADCVVRPEWYFQRRAVPRLDSELHEYATELWAHAQDILLARRLERWPRNSGACMLYRTPCKYLGICSGYDTPDSDNWRRLSSVHPELPGIEDGRDVLTNSRIRCFQTCRRKHYLQYEMGIDRQDEEEREALVFGTVWHLALEAWFNASKEKEQQDDDDHDDAGSPENASGTAADETPRHF